MDIEKIKELAVPILKQYGVEKAAIFGSYAKGNQNQDSDIDILIEYAPSARKSLLIRARIIDELKNALKRDVDVVTEKSLSRFFRDEVLREMKVIM
jgi:predicted nucleotidyltransferase